MKKTFIIFAALVFLFSFASCDTNSIVSIGVGETIPYVSSDKETFFSDLEKAQDPTFLESRAGERMRWSGAYMLDWILIPCSQNVKTFSSIHAYEECVIYKYDGGASITIWLFDLTDEKMTMNKSDSDSKEQSNKDDLKFFYRETLAKIDHDFPQNWLYEGGFEDPAQLHQWFTFALYELDESGKVVLVDDNIFAE